MLALEFGMSFDRFGFDGIMPFNFVGQEIFKRAVKGMNIAIDKVFAETGLTTDDIDSLIPHQANKRLIDYLAKRCNVPESKTVINIQKYGNTSSATLPMLMQKHWSRASSSPAIPSSRQCSVVA